MSVHLLCITSNSGLPIFTRKRGEGDALPFSVVASLNGVHMFTKSQGVTIKSTSTEDTTLVWEEFEESGTRASEWIIRRLLRAAFGAMVLLVGLEEIRLIRNADRFKRELRVCYPLLDALMDAVDSVSSGSSKNNSAGTLLGLSEAILCPEHSVLLSCLESYASCIDSSFACLLAHGRQVVSTPAWSDLHPLERQLLASLVVTGGLCSSSDVPVFLPYKSPSVAFRLVSILVVRDVYVMALCGPTPSLAEAEHLTVQCWAACIDHLHNVRSIVPNNIPLSLTFDSGVLGGYVNETEKFLNTARVAFDNLGVSACVFVKMYPMFATVGTVPRHPLTHASRRGRIADSENLQIPNNRETIGLVDMAAQLEGLCGVFNLWVY